MEHKKSDMNGIIYDEIEEYTINKFIAVGGESIVFKGEKKSVGRTYALKFRDMERWGDFFSYELKTLSRLEQCSTSKLAGVIPVIPVQLLQELYRIVPDNKKKQCANLTSPYAHYFCIIEDYIAGCDLNEYCNGDESKGIIGHTPLLNASYEQVVEFQRKLLQWTMQFCEIMSHVTEEHHFLHLDIKPENIMVSNETESITVIDFGKSMEMDPASSVVSLNKEFGNNIGVYGTNGFAAPECCDSVAMRNALNLPSTGIVDQRSDIFSFGATLWDCINPQPNIHINILTGFFCFLLILSLAINARRSHLTFEIAKNNFQLMAEDYTEHNIADYKDTAIALIEANPEEKQSYLDVLQVAYQDDDSVSKTELEEVLLKCLDYTSDEEIMVTYVNTIMQHLNDINAKTISESLSIRKSLDVVHCDGMQIANAIANYSSNPVGSYDTLEKYGNQSEYYNALFYLNKILMNDSNIKKSIADAKGISVDDLKSPFV